MPKPSRRDFLKVGAAALGSAALGELLAGCGSTMGATALPAVSATPPTQRAVLPMATARDANTQPPPTATSPVLPDIAVARNGAPEDLVRRAIAALGDMGRFVSKGANVIVKPNICVAYHGYEYAATTNPWIVGTLVKLCFEAGAGSVKVMDFPFGGTQAAAYAISGIQEHVEAAGGVMAPMPALKYASVAIPGALRLKTVDIFEDILKADAVINVPIAKVHGLSRLTIGMKNLLGVVRDRPVLHAHISENLADLASLVRPTLTVVDAVRILVSNGPTGGSLDDVKKLDTVVASPDLVAADSYGATLFGIQPDSLGYIVAATAMGLGRSDLQNLRIEEIQVGTAQ